MAEVRERAREIARYALHGHAEEVIAEIVTYGDARYRAGMQAAAETIRHKYHIAGCEFHRFSMNIGKVCPDPKHEVLCSHCGERIAAVLAEVRETWAPATAGETQ